MSNLIQMTLLILAALVVYRFRARILGALRRFDDRVAARRSEEMRDRQDHHAHYKHTLRLAEEQVEEVQTITVPDQRTAQPVTRYLFEGEQFATREDAEEVRRLMERLRNAFRCILLDSPPLLAASDANLLAALADGTLLVTRIGATTTAIPLPFSGGRKT